MEIKHRITFNHLADVKETLNALKVKTEQTTLPAGGYLIHVDISESDPQWPEVETLARKKQAADVYDTVFSSEEIRTAAWNRLIPFNEKGYPQPEKDHKWKDIVYQGVCQTCGVGFRQKAPFHIKQEPRLGNKDFMTLYWTYALFAITHVFQALKEHKIVGYEKWPVILHKSGEHSRIISQVYVSSHASLGLADSDKVQPEVCPSCGITKYGYHKHGYLRFSRKAINNEVDIQLTQEWFGSGRYGGHQEILISRRLSLLVLDNGWKGVRLKPIQLV